MKVTYFSRMMLTLAGLLLAIGGLASAKELKPAGSAGIGPWGAIVVGQQTEPERLATVDLQRYLAQVTGRVPAILSAGQWKAQPTAAVVTGTPETNELLKELKLDPQAVGDQGYMLEEKPAGKARLILAAGRTPEGAVNAVYGLLKELGFGFYLGSEAAPRSLPAGLSAKTLVRQPLQKIRGVLPWYNFFNSPTTWDPIDHRTFVDQLVRTGSNFVGFHTYENEPFAACEDENGQMKWGARLLNTASSTWSTRPVAADDFAFGTGRLFADKYFGAATSLTIKNDTEAIRAEQNVMRDALDYAKKRGLHTCIGFEAIGDPTDPKVRDIFLRRFNHLLDQYPAVDYIWVWESEVMGTQGFISANGQNLENNPLLPYGVARRETFKRIVERTAGARPFFQENEMGKIARSMEGARLEQFAQLAWHALQHRANAPRLVVSGWGGDERLLSAEYYEGLDKLLPKDIVFASLDNIPPRKRVDTIYHELPKDRERWPIVWMEGDGDEWHPQPSIYQYLEDCAKDIQKSGSQGLLTIHWRTRDIEENFGYLMEYAWQPGLSADKFFAEMARRCYGPAIAAEMADIHIKLDKLQYRWVGGVGQSECGEFEWGPGVDENVKGLRALRARAAALLPKVDPSNPQSARKLKWLVSRMDWVLNFRETEVAAVKARELLAQARGEKPAEAKAKAEEALALLDRGDFPKALHADAQLLSTRGEYGVLATINTKAVAAWRDLRKQALDTLGRQVPENDRWDPAPQIILPRLFGSTVERQDLELLPISLGGKPAWAHYRPLGGGEWTTVALAPVKGWVQRVTIPAAAVLQPGLELGFSFSKSPAQKMALGPIAVTVMPATTVYTAPRQVVPVDTKPKLSPVVHEGKLMPVELTWTDEPEADLYKIYRDGKLMVETAVAFFPDAPPTATGNYVVEAWRDGRVIGRSADVPFALADKPITEKSELAAYPSQAGVLLSWPATRSPLVAAYKVRRVKAGALGLLGGKVIAHVPATRLGEHFYFDKPPRGKWQYRVTPVNAAGREGQAALANAAFAPVKNPKPVIDLPLTEKPNGAEVIGPVNFGPDGATFAGGYITLPHNKAMDLGHGLTVDFEFKAEDFSGMPVALCHGMSMGDGWFAQIMSQEMCIQSAGGNCYGFGIEKGKWYSVRWVFDGIRFHVSLNGQWLVEPKAMVQPIPAERKLIIGQYDALASQYAFKGSVRNVRIYSDVLLDDKAK